MNAEGEKSRLPRVEAPTQRLFFALWPSEEVRSGLAEVMASLHVGRAKPVLAENLHITLLFLGSVTAQTRICAETVAEGIAGHPFELRLDQIGLWPKSGILWVGAREVPESLAALVRDLHLGIAGCGIDLDARPFKPHVTLMRKALVVRRERPLVAVAWRVDDFALVESKTTPDGAHYQVLTSWRLGADSRGVQGSLGASSPYP
ncbi:MAG: RNA 2',3'-cyclic phosphodiesterase [Chromatiales bacterium USCg_Taylor]|nr:MAG: RNA 2',3'-cyclic phosphodiesterase [Chromatiales bacterium USCg_Taylor]